jgi:hypothetical protein
VENFTDHQRSQLLKFVTSCSRPPLLGFKVSICMALSTFMMWPLGWYLGYSEALSDLNLDSCVPRKLQTYPLQSFFCNRHAEIVFSKTSLMVCHNWVGKLLEEKLCVQHDSRYGDFKSHNMLKIEFYISNDITIYSTISWWCILRHVLGIVYSVSLILSYQPTPPPPPPPDSMIEAETVSVTFDTVSMFAVEGFFAHSCRESF